MSHKRKYPAIKPVYVAMEHHHWSNPSPVQIQAASPVSIHCAHSPTKINFNSSLKKELCSSKDSKDDTKEKERYKSEKGKEVEKDIIVQWFNKVRNSDVIQEEDETVSCINVREDDFMASFAECSSKHIQIKNKLVDQAVNTCTFIHPTHQAYDRLGFAYFSIAHQRLAAPPKLLRDEDILVVSMDKMQRSSMERFSSQQKQNGYGQTMKMNRHKESMSSIKGLYSKNPINNNNNNNLNWNGQRESRPKRKVRAESMKIREGLTINPK